MTFVIVTHDTQRKREMYWMCDCNRFGYYEEHATVFASEPEAEAIRKYCAPGGTVRPTLNTRPEQP